MRRWTRCAGAATTSSSASVPSAPTARSWPAGHAPSPRRPTSSSTPPGCPGRPTAPPTAGGAPGTLGRLRNRLSDERREGVRIRPDQRFYALAVDVRDDDLADLRPDDGEDAQLLHPLGLGPIVLGRREVVDRAGPIAMDQEQLDERHQPPPADRGRRV